MIQLKKHIDKKKIYTMIKLICTSLLVDLKATLSFLCQAIILAAPIIELPGRQILLRLVNKVDRQAYKSEENIKEMNSETTFK